MPSINSLRIEIECEEFARLTRLSIALRAVGLTWLANRIPVARWRMRGRIWHTISLSQLERLA